MPRPVIPTDVIDLDKLLQNYLSLIASAEVNRLLEDITTCSLSRVKIISDSSDSADLKGGIELFPFLRPDPSPPTFD